MTIKADASTISQAVPFGDAVKYWLKLGFISFGGPAGQISMMHQELVERRRWISEHRFMHALNYCMVLPGPWQTSHSTPGNSKEPSMPGRPAVLPRGL